MQKASMKKEMACCDKIFNQKQIWERADFVIFKHNCDLMSLAKKKLKMQHWLTGYCGYLQI